MSTAARVTQAVTISSALGAALLAAPAAHAQNAGPWMDVSLATAVHGTTVDVTYTDKGAQYALDDDGTTWTPNESMGFELDYGDGSTPAGANGGGGASCRTSGAVHPFGMTTSAGLSHTYAKAGTYTITATGYYCGGGTQNEVTKTYRVTVGSAGTTKPQPEPTQPAPGSPTTGSPTVHADAHIRYTLKGNTASITPYMTGTQHEMEAMGRPVRLVSPWTFSMKWPESAKWLGGSAAGDAGAAICTQKGSVNMAVGSVPAEPIVLKFPGPGTYPVSFQAGVCTPQDFVSKSVNIVIPGAGSATGSTGSTAVPSAPSAPSAPQVPASASAPAKGPHVDTDRVSGSDAGQPWGLVALGGLGAVGAGAVVTRRRLQRRG